MQHCATEQRGEERAMNSNSRSNLAFCAESKKKLPISSIWKQNWARPYYFEEYQIFTKLHGWACHCSRSTKVEQETVLRQIKFFAALSRWCLFIIEQSIEFRCDRRKSRCTANCGSNRDKISISRSELWEGIMWNSRNTILRNNIRSSRPHSSIYSSSTRVPNIVEKWGKNPIHGNSCKSKICSFIIYLEKFIACFANEPQLSAHRDFRGPRRKYVVWSMIKSKIVSVQQSHLNSA